MKQTHLDLSAIKHIMKIIDKTMNSTNDLERSKTYCLGFILGVAMYTDLEPTNASELQKYIEKRYTEKKNQFKDKNKDKNNDTAFESF